MTKCHYCGKEVICPFKCSYCGELFCEEHRLPPKHEYPNIEAWKSAPAPKVSRAAMTRSKYLHPGPPPSSDDWEPVEAKVRGYKLKNRILKLLVALLLIGLVAYAAQEGYIDKIGNEAGGYLKKTKIGSELKPFIEPPLKNETNLRLAEKLVLDYTNKERVKYGLKPLKWNEALARAAILHSEDMGVRDYFSHISPEGEGPDDRVLKEGMITQSLVRTSSCWRGALSSHLTSLRKRA